MYKCRLCTFEDRKHVLDCILGERHCYDRGVLVYRCAGHGCSLWLLDCGYWFLWHQQFGGDIEDKAPCRFGSKDPGGFWSKPLRVLIATPLWSDYQWPLTRLHFPLRAPLFTPIKLRFIQVAWLLHNLRFTSLHVGPGRRKHTQLCRGKGTEPSSGEEEKSTLSDTAKIIVFLCRRGVRLLFAVV